MKKLALISLGFCLSWAGLSQDIPPASEQQLENLTEADQAETEDDSYLQQLERFKKNPVNLNLADEIELRELKIVTDLQIQSLISYRKVFGALIDIYELQAVPSWDLLTIRKLLPFITVVSKITIKEDFSTRFGDGDHSFLIRFSQVLENSEGFDKSGSGPQYAGSPLKILFRYGYTYKNLLQFGITGDKDAGEQFFKGSQRKGFDFYSFHLFARKVGIIQSLAIGDFTVNMGQGLIQWQSLAFKKSADITAVKRQSAVLRPYNSGGEFNFHRGIGISVQKGKTEATVFGSIRKLNANIVVDSINRAGFISSFLTSGYNRTTGELADRNSVQQIAFGGNVRYRGNSCHIGVNGIYYKFSLPVSKANDPYNLYAAAGNTWYNFSADYSYTHRNVHFFGETAVDKDFEKAFLNGILVSIDPRVDVSIVHRHIQTGYQAINGNAFTENTSPANESGLYAGITIRPSANWRVDAYADIYKFPWLKYLVDAPSYGKDFTFQLFYTPNKQVEIYTRFRSETKQGNQPGNNTTTNYLIELPKQNWRTHLSYKINSTVTLRNRIELIWYGKNEDISEKGFLVFFDFVYRPLLKPYSAVIRLQYFETGGYNSRLYAFENDVLYSFSIPAFFDKGYRYYLLLNHDVTKRISIWFRWAQTIYRDKKLIGSGSDEIRGNKKSELKLQARYLF